MTDNDQPPPDIAEHARAVQAWLDEKKPAPVQQPQPQQFANAIDRFKATVRSDSPPQMPAWNSALIGNPQSQSHERAVDRFMRQRLERK